MAKPRFWMATSPVRKKLDICAALPIVISGYCDSSRCLDNIKAALEHNDRVWLSISWGLDDFFAALEKPLPMLVDLALWSGLWSGSWRNLSPVHLNPFKLLGGSSRLRCFSLRGIRFPELPNLLLSSTDLVYLGNFSFRVHFTRGISNARSRCW
jgi:hypothetical protein